MYAIWRITELKKTWYLFTWKVDRKVISFQWFVNILDKILQTYRRRTFQSKLANFFMLGNVMNVPTLMHFTTTQGVI